MSLLDSRDKNLAQYNDHKKSQVLLVKSSDYAKSVLNDSSARTQDIINANIYLENNIAPANAYKTAFDQKNSELIKAYEQLKEYLITEPDVLPYYSGNELDAVRIFYTSAKNLVNNTLEPLEGEVPTLVEVNITNRNLLLAIQDVIIRRNISSIGSGGTFPS